MQSFLPLYEYLAIKASIHARLPSNRLNNFVAGLAPDEEENPQWSFWSVKVGLINNFDKNII